MKSWKELNVMAETVASTGSDVDVEVSQILKSIAGYDPEDTMNDAGAMDFLYPMIDSDDQVEAQAAQKALSLIQS